MTKLLPWVFLALACLIPLAVHRVEEGHVGVYYRGGALLPTISDPGYALMLPLVTTYLDVQTTIQTDEVVNIPCGTRGGVLIYFEKVEVVNRLKKAYVAETIREYGANYDKLWIFDKIHHELNQFCSKHTLQEVYIDLFDTVDDCMKTALQTDVNTYAPGIEIISVRVTKPKLPESIKKNYEALEGERMKLLVSTQHQLVVEKEAETDRKRAVVEAQKQAEISEIKHNQLVAERESMKKQQAISDGMMLAQEKALADAKAYAIKSEAEANKHRLTPEYLHIEMIKSVASNTKFYFGDKIPTTLFEGGKLPWEEKSERS